MLFLGFEDFKWEEVKKSREIALLSVDSLLSPDFEIDSSSSDSSSRSKRSQGLGLLMTVLLSGVPNADENDGLVGAKLLLGICALDMR